MGWCSFFVTKVFKLAINPAELVYATICAVYLSKLYP